MTTRHPSAGPIGAACLALLFVSCARPGVQAPAGDAARSPTTATSPTSAVHAVPADTPLAAGAQADTLLIQPLPLPRGMRPGEPEREPGLRFTVTPLPAHAEVDRPDVGPTGGPQEPLPDAVVAALLARLPALPPAGVVPFRFPAASPPPPRAGAVVVAGFPRDTTLAPPRPPATPGGETRSLRVLRIVPEGDAGPVPHVTVTFSEPMVPLTSVAATDALAPPVRLEPQPRGTWSWIDVRTARFTAAPRLPMATRYRVVVPAGTRALGGATLEAAVEVVITTPGPSAIGGYPVLVADDAPWRPSRWMGYGHHPQAAYAQPDQVMIVVFDQPVAPPSVLATTRFLADGRPHPVRLATDAELAADSVARALADSARSGHWVAFAPARPLPRGALARLVVGAGTTALEGPLGSAAAQELRFRTFGPLRVVAHECAGGDECRPGHEWTIRFSNPLDTLAWSDALARIEPSLDEAALRVDGAHLVIRGLARPHTRYTVRLDPAIRDVFGQTLGEPATAVFSVGASEPVAVLGGAPMIVLDPGGPPVVTVRSLGVTSLAVQVYRVRPEDYPAWTTALEAWQYGRGERLAPPGTKVVDRTVPVGGGRAYAETLVDISAALTGGVGHAVVVVEPQGGRTADRERSRTAHAWVQATRIGLNATVDVEELLAWATSLEDGRPLAGAELRLLPSGRRARTDAQGLATLPLGTEADHVLVARVGDDAALLSEAEHHHRSEGWARRQQQPQLLWYTLSDRGLYRPGETAHLRGWLRERAGGRSRQPGLPAVDGVRYRVRGPRGEDVAQGEARVLGRGGFHAAIELPDALNLGHAGIELEARGGGAYAAARSHLSLQVQEFRRPDYEVVVEADPGPRVVGDVVHATLQARYYGGGGLGGAAVRWRVRTESGQYAPPGWSGWQFGRSGYGGRLTGMNAEELDVVTAPDGTHRIAVDLRDVDPPFVSRLHAAADVQDLTRQVGSGSVQVLVHPAMVHVGLRLSRSWVRPGQAFEVESVVVDHDGAVVRGRPVEIVLERFAWTWHPAGARLDSLDSRAVCDITSGDAPQSCTVVTTEPGSYRLRADVRDAAGRTSRTERVFWVSGPGSGMWRPGETPDGVQLMPDREEYQPGDTARVLLQAPFHPAEGLLTVRTGGVARTERFRVGAATHELRVAIGDDDVPAVGIRVELVDSTGLRAAAGEARLAVPPEGRRLDVLVTPAAAVVVPGAETWIDVAVKDADGRPVAGADVALWMVDEAVLDLGGFRVPDPLEQFFPPHYPYIRDHRNRGWVVPWPRSAGPNTVSGRLQSGIAEGRPLTGATVRVEGLAAEATTDYDGVFTLPGVPPGEHVLVVRLRDGVTLRRTLRVPPEGVHLGSIVVTPAGDLEVTAQARALSLAPQMEAPVAVAPLPPAPPPPPAPGAGAAKASEIEVREDFAALAFFEPSVITDADGRARVRVRLPGNLTRYRVMAVAAAGADHFGTGEANLTARRDLMVRITAPRFLNHGDRFELPVLVQNATDSPLAVDVAVRASGVALGGPAGRRITLPAGGRAELRFDAAVDAPGTAQVQAVAAATGAAADAARTDAAVVSIPVYSPATTEAFAVHGHIDTDAPVVLPVVVPTGVLPQFGGLDVTVTATALHALTDAVIYLQQYPFEGAEHIASRLLSVVALRDVLAAFDAPGLGSRVAIDDAVRRDVARLVALQSQDGGWGFWRPDEPSHPFVSVHVAHALQRATERGYTVPPLSVARSTQYLRTVAGHAREWPAAPRRALESYAVYVRHRLGDPDALREARRIATAPPDRVGSDLSLEAMGWLLHVLTADPASRETAAELMRRIGNRVDVTAGTATFAERYTDGEHLLLHSRRRTDAIVLEALIAADPSHDLIPRVAQSLLANRVAGAWRGPQENVWVLLALDRYFRTYEAVTPDFMSRVWLGERYAGGHAFRGRTTDRARVDVPMPQLAATPATDVVIGREGQGRLYYRAALRYAPADPRVAPQQRGFTVSRTYEAVDDPGDVRQETDGTWRVRAGARVRVVVSLVAPSVRHHVALVDPLPAGFEPVNPGLQGTGSDRPSPMRGQPVRPAPPPPLWPGLRWYTHENLRDDRAEAFATLLPAGVYEYSYLARATTPGTWVVAPPRAEMMYEPETFGHGAGTRVFVEAEDRQ